MPLMDVLLAGIALLACLLICIVALPALTKETSQGCVIIENTSDCYEELRTVPDTSMYFLTKVYTTKTIAVTTCRKETLCPAH